MRAFPHMSRRRLRRGDETAGTAIHSKNGNVDWRVAGLLAAGSVPATVLLSRMPKQSPTKTAIISMSIGVALIIVVSFINSVVD